MTLTNTSRTSLETMIWAETTARRNVATLARCSVGKCFGVWTATIEWEPIK